MPKTTDFMLLENDLAPLAASAVAANSLPIHPIPLQSSANIPAPLAACHFHNDPAETWELLARMSDYKGAVLARKCGVSLRTLQRHFAKHYQVPLSLCLRRMRLAQAYARLQNGERIKSVAFDLGYKQLSHFSRDFKLHYGVPPSTLKQPLDPIWLHCHEVSSRRKTFPNSSR